MFGMNGILHPNYSGFDGFPRGMMSGFVQLDAAIDKYCPETYAWLQQLAIPPSKFWTKALDRMIRTMKNDGNWQYLDRMLIFATEQRSHALVSVVNPNGITTTWPTNAAEVPNGGTMSWARNLGYTGDGVASYINTNTTPSSLSNFSLNNAAFGTYITQVGSSTNQSILGTDVGGGNFTTMFNWNSNDFYYNINSNNVHVVITQQNGFYQSQRLNNSIALLYRNGKLLGSLSAPSIGVSTGPMYLLSSNLNGSPGGFSNDTLSMFFISGGGVNYFSMFNAFEQFAATIGFAILAT
jgi:hypothetical protein